MAPRSARRSAAADPESGSDEFVERSSPAVAAPTRTLRTRAKVEEERVEERLNSIRPWHPTARATDLPGDIVRSPL